MEFISSYKCLPNRIIERIHRMPIPINDVEDKMVENSLLKINFLLKQQHELILVEINLIPKVKLSIWKLARNILLTKDKLRNCGM